MLRKISPLVVAVIGAGLIAGVSIRVLSGSEWDASVFVGFGEDATPTRDYAEQRLGSVFLRPSQGHDGKFFFVQANDPWVLEPDQHAEVLDRPRYRSQRMLYPMLAGGGGLFAPAAIPWAMLLVNIVAMGAGTWVVARIAEEMGGSPWWGLAFALNLGFISEVNIGGAGVVAATAAFGAVLALKVDRRVLAVVLLALAALSREAMLIAAAGSALWLWMQGERRVALTTALVPVAAVAAWAAYLRVQIGGASVVSEVQEIGWPFYGFIEAFSSWVEDPIDLVVGVAMMVLFVLFIRRVLISRGIVGLAFAGFAVLGVVFTEQVWRSYFDITRAVAPVITSFVLLMFLSQNSAERTGVRPSNVLQ